MARLMAIMPPGLAYKNICWEESQARSNRHHRLEAKHEDTKDMPCKQSLLGRQKGFMPIDTCSVVGAKGSLGGRD